MRRRREDTPVAVLDPPANAEPEAAQLDERDEPAIERTGWEGDVELVAVKDIFVGPNARPEAELGDLDELAASIRAQGLLSPILLRTRGFGGGYELVCGERRFRAVERLGWTQVRAVVRAMSDDDARACNLVENLQRLDVSPIAQAEGFRLLSRPPYRLSYGEIARRCGKPAWYVERSVEALGLPTPVLDAVRAGWLPWPSAQQLLRVADLGLRVEFGLDLVGRRGDLGDVRPSDVRAWIDEQLADLGMAQWDLADAELVPTAGACDSCPYRSRHVARQVPLFAETETTEGRDTCTKPKCYEAKAQAHFERAAAQHRAAGGGAVITKQAGPIFEKWDGHAVAWGAEYVDLEQPYNGSGKRTLRQLAGDKLDLGHVAIARDPAGRARLLVHKKQLPKLLEAAGIKARDLGSSGARVTPSLTPQEKAARRRKQLNNAIGPRLRERLFDEIDVRLNQELSPQVFRWAVGRVLGGLRQEAKPLAVRWGWEARGNTWDAHVTWLRRKLDEGDDAESRRVFLGLACEVGRSLFLGPAAPGGEAELAELLGIDVKAIRAEVAEPLKALAAERETAIKAKAKKAGKAGKPKKSVPTPEVKGRKKRR